MGGEVRCRVWVGMAGGGRVGGWGADRNFPNDHFG